MHRWNKDNTLFIMIPNGYNAKEIIGRGYRVFRPYNDQSIVGRIIRELWFRIPILPNRVWYNSAIICDGIKFLLVNDTLITREYLIWLHEQFPAAQINFLYNNMVGKANHLLPKQIPSFVRIWTYDDYDARTYNLHLYPYSINMEKGVQKREPDIDVFFVGKDKGRGEWLVDFEKKLQSMGLVTKFIITKDGRFSKKKRYYQRVISYQEVLEYDARSKAILNVVMDNQEGITLRDIEAITINVKLITTNKHIVSKDFFNHNNIFVLGEREIEELVEFLESKPEPISQELIEKHSFEHRMDVITGEA